MKKRHIVCYTVHVGLMVNDEWITLDSEEEARDLYQELQSRDNVSSVILALPLEGKEVRYVEKV